MLSIIDIIEDTTVDGPGFRTAIYAAGCPNKCPGCHNPESWDIHKGKKVRTEEIVEKVLADEFANVTFSGGDPMFQPEGFTEVAKAIKEKSQKTIWCYTGNNLEHEIWQPGPGRCEVSDEFLQYIDVLVDGDFVQDQYDISLRFRGSSNQRIIDMNKTRAAGRVVLWQDDPIFADHTM